jgi:LPXTG-site transpeptidase (sortase) family protein
MLFLMRRFLANLDRQMAIAAGILAVSLVFVAAGAFVIIRAAAGGGAGLPNEGSIEDIIRGSPRADGAAAPGGGPEGPPPPLPVRMLIPKLYIDAPVITMGVTPDNYPEVPGRPDQVAWYDFSAPPGRDGNAVFSGHVDWQSLRGSGIPGVFYRLREMKVGDLIEVVLEDGAVLQYRVTGNVATRYDDPDILAVMGPSGRDVITLITCAGSWVIDHSQQFGGNYSHRVIVRAERVLGLAGAGAAAGG